MATKKREDDPPSIRGPSGRPSLSQANASSAQLFQRTSRAQSQLHRINAGTPGMVPLAKATSNQERARLTKPARSMAGASQDQSRLFQRLSAAQSWLSRRSASTSNLGALARASTNEERAALVRMPRTLAETSRQQSSAFMQASRNQSSQFSAASQAQSQLFQRMSNAQSWLFSHGASTSNLGALARASTNEERAALVRMPRTLAEAGRQQSSAFLQASRNQSNQFIDSSQTQSRLFQRMSSAQSWLFVHGASTRNLGALAMATTNEERASLVSLPARFRSKPPSRALVAALTALGAPGLALFAGEVATALSPAAPDEAGPDADVAETEQDGRPSVDRVPASGEGNADWEFNEQSGRWEYEQGSSFFTSNVRPEEIEKLIRDEMERRRRESAATAPKRAIDTSKTDAQLDRAKIPESMRDFYKRLNPGRATDARTPGASSIKIDTRTPGADSLKERAQGMRRPGLQRPDLKPSMDRMPRTPTRERERSAPRINGRSLALPKTRLSMPELTHSRGAMHTAGFAAARALNHMRMEVMAS